MNIRSPQKHNLKAHLAEVVKRFPDIIEIYLFGSRAYKTGSLRSDCDLLVRVSDNGWVHSSALRDYSMEECPPIDFFLAIGGRAISCSNDSSISAPTFDDLVKKLDAILLWSKAAGFSAFEFSIEAKWVFETTRYGKFAASSLPDSAHVEDDWQAVLKRTEEECLPVRPFMGETVDKVVAQLTEVAKRMFMRGSDLAGNGQARAGWTVNIKDEYDCQNLFWTVAKPWLPGLEKEPFVIHYQNQDKKADFALADGRIVIEFKHVESEAKKREILKDLAGLSNFYSRNGNIRCLLMLIFYREAASFDVLQIENDYTFFHTRPSVVTHLIKIPD